MTSPSPPLRCRRCLAPCSSLDDAATLALRGLCESCYLDGDEEWEPSGVWALPNSEFPPRTIHFERRVVAGDGE